jgi:hypothetical protein
MVAAVPVAAALEEPSPARRVAAAVSLVPAAAVAVQAEALAARVTLAF